MKFKHIFLIALLGIILTSCQKDLVIDIPPHDAKLVVNAIQTVGEPFWVHLSKSYPIPNEIKAEELLVNDAKVEIWEGGNLLTTLIYTDTLVLDDFNWNPAGTPDLLLGHYQGPDNVVVESGKTYELRVEHATLENVLASTNVLEVKKPVTFSLDVDAISETDIDGYVYKSHVLSVTVDDEPGVDNYYSFRLAGVVKNPFDSTFFDTLELYNGGSLNNWTETSFDLSGDYWASDEGMDGQQLKLEFLAHGSFTYWIDNQEVTAEPETLILEFQTANKDAYQYMNGIRKQRNSDPTNPFYPAEAIVVPGNIDGGYGAFGAMGSVVEIK